LRSNRTPAAHIAVAEPEGDQGECLPLNWAGKSPLAPSVNSVLSMSSRRALNSVLSMSRAVTPNGPASRRTTGLKELIDVQTDVVVEIRGKLAAVGRLTGAELQNRTEVVAKSVLDKVPNADRLLAATMLTSLFCQILNDSALSDTEKLNRLDKFTERIDALI
jgi:hypothetical protein